LSEGERPAGVAEASDFPAAEFPAGFCWVWAARGRAARIAANATRNFFFN
jgi:hypothetical protein